MGSCISLTEENALAHKPLQNEHDSGQPYGGNPHAILNPNQSLSQNKASEANESLAIGLKENGSAKSSQTFPEPPKTFRTLYSDTGLRIFTFDELRLATKNFRKECLLGEGGFGSVYKGRITDPTGSNSMGELVAVKKLNTEGLQGHKEWMAEVDILGQLHHPNLVRLVGYCSEDDQRLLVYEFMPRGSLELHLFRRTSSVLSWHNRIKIALGAAKGLAYLHEEAERFVIYRDFKTSNILLDNEFNAKLSDFGLAKDGPEGDKTHVSTRVMGTYGYAAPEYVMTGHLTPKSDVYSYGVVLLEMITGRRSMDKTRPREEHNLVDWSRQFFSDRRKLFHIIDPRLEGRFSIRGAQKACMLAQHCLCRDPKARPLMSDVVETLLPLQDLTDMASNYFQEGSNKDESQE